MTLKVFPPGAEEDYGAVQIPPVAVSAGSGGTIITKDEGVLVDAAATTLNFVGAGVTATDAGGNVTTVTIPTPASIFDWGKAISLNKGVLGMTR